MFELLYKDLKSALKKKKRFKELKQIMSIELEL